LIEVVCEGATVETTARVGWLLGLVPLAKMEEALRLYQETYFDPNMRHFQEKLDQEHGIKLSYTWAQKARSRRLGYC